jgi:hypothetical protein
MSEPLAAETEHEEVGLPEDAAAWRELLARIPARQLLKDIRANTALSRTILQGFRGGTVDVVRNPVVAQRILEAAQRNPMFARLLVAGANLTVAVEPAPLEKATPPAPGEPSIEKDDSKLKAKLKELRAAVQARESQLTELQSQLTTFGRERDGLRAELELERKARLAAEAATERERRQRERESRRAEKTEKSARTKIVAAAEPLPATSTTVVPAAFEEAMRRLLNRGRYDMVAEVCRELLATPEGSALERGVVHSLAALALHGLGSALQAEEQDRQAVGTYLDAGLVAPAAEAFGRLLAYSASPALKAPETALLTRLLALAQKLGAMDDVQAVFGRLRVTAPAGYARLRRALTDGKKHAHLLEALTEGAASTPTVGPDETVALPVTGKTAAVVTARLLVQAVERGDENFVTCARDGIGGLRGDQPALADGLLAAVATLQNLAVIPLTSELLRPVVVDASNVARHNPDPLAAYLPSPPPPAVANLLAMRDHLLRRGFFPVLLIADASLRHHVDDRAAYGALLERGCVQEVSAGTSADEVLIREARNRAAPLVTNDRLAEWGEAARRIERIGFDIAASGRVSLL